MSIAPWGADLYQATADTLWTGMIFQDVNAERVRLAKRDRERPSDPSELEQPNRRHPSQRTWVVASLIARPDPRSAPHRHR